MNVLPSILIVVTSFGELAPGEPTGLWLEEFAVPYMEFNNRGFDITVASIEGGKAPVDPRSTPSPEQARQWSNAIQALDETVSITSIDATKYNAVFMPGGHGTMFDLPTSVDLQKILKTFAENDKIIASVCHGPSSFVGVTLSDGTPLVKGRIVTSFTNKEEQEAGFENKMPFLLETQLTKLGARFVEKPNWSDHVQIDGNLITGQNPQSSKSIALAIINALNTNSGDQQ